MTGERTISPIDHILIVAQAIDLFVGSADQLYGPITTVHTDGQVIKSIPWSAFRCSNRDWTRVLDARNILAVSVSVLACCLKSYEWWL
jgi:hypothetical protein